MVIDLQNRLASFQSLQVNLEVKGGSCSTVSKENKKFDCKDFTQVYQYSDGIYVCYR